jgi:hypothetical protein
MYPMLTKLLMSKFHSLFSLEGLLIIYLIINYRCKLIVL